MKFGEKIKEQRKKARLYQEDVAKAIGVTKRTLANYEGGFLGGNGVIWKE